MISREERARGCLLGLCVGDALYGPAEFMSPEQIQACYAGPLTEMVGGGWLDLRAGEGTDDSAMALALAEAIMERGEFQERAVLRAYLDWFQTEPPDVGGTVRGALQGVLSGLTPEQAVREFHQANGGSGGNGSIMRCAPLALAARSPQQLAEWAARDAALTHFDPDGQAACRAFLALLASFLHGWPASPPREEKIRASMSWSRQKAEEEALRNPGYVLTALGVACAARREAEKESDPSQAFPRALIWTGNLGGDADTNAAVSGALLGCLYGEHAIPARWQLRLEEGERARRLASGLLALA